MFEAAAPEVAMIPVTAPAALVTVQALIGDRAGSGGIAATNGLAIAIQ